MSPAEDQGRRTIEVTPEMIEAGIEALSEFEPGDGSRPDEIVISVFLRMLAELPSGSGLDNPESSTGK